MTPDELERLLEAHPRFRKADPKPKDQVDITFVSRPSAEAQPADAESPACRTYSGRIEPAERSVSLVNIHKIARALNVPSGRLPS